MPDFAVILNLILSASIATCGIILVLGVLGFIWALLRGKPFFRSCLFGVAVVMLSLLLPGAFAVATYVAYNGTSTFMTNAAEATGEVVRLVEVITPENQTVFSAVVEYTPAGGSPIQFDDNGVACDPACHQVGQVVTVLYDPADPANATIKNSVVNWIWVLVLGLLTVICLLIAVGYIVHSYRKDRYFILIDEWQQ
jgi:cell division protein FtsW (lipid II flippase)